MPKSVWFLTVLLFLLPCKGFSYQDQAVFQIPNPKKASLEAKKVRGLGPTLLEKSAKSDLIEKHIKQKREFYSQYFSDIPSELQKSWIYEVEEAYKEYPRLFSGQALKKPHLYDRLMTESKIETAKILAKKEFFDQTMKYWSCLGGYSPANKTRKLKTGEKACISQTVFNKDGIPDDPQHREEAKEFIIHSFSDSFNYVPKNPYARPAYFLFHVEDLGFIEIDKKTLKKGRVIFEIGTQYTNELEPHADEIKADDDPSLNNGVPRRKSNRPIDSAVETNKGNANIPAPANIPPPPPIGGDEDF